MTDNDASIRDHYNKILNYGVKGREATATKSVRFFNNYVKALLINTQSERMKHLFSSTIRNRKLSILDLCCGKGGDLKKWQKIANYYVGIDIADQSLSEAVNRYAQSKQRGYGFDFARFFCCNLGTQYIENALPKGLYFHMVSCQMAIHYFFENQEKARTFFRNVSCRLKKGGILICTTIDADCVVKRVRQTQVNPFDSRVPLETYHEAYDNMLSGKDSSANGMDDPSEILPNTYYGLDTDDVVQYGNALFHFKFEKPIKFTKFGCGYKFYLQGSVEDETEYVTHYSVMEEVAKEFGMRLAARPKPFIQFFHETKGETKNYRLMKEMKVLNDENSIDSIGWDLAHYYVTMVFEKFEDVQIEGKMPDMDVDQEFTNINFIQ
eukprot:TRINITY_DN685_c0_g1_i1.p1 TRINITY_DN685_c0_g1~~TRINITY_DN685_c0_g1_i1.p1  ORF type:complete len:380 (+),score=98.67 TRINITY_DN685_c0_g1_i1:35-1174(+)